MKRIFEYFTNRLIPRDKSPARLYRTRIGKLQGWISILVNVLLFIIKFWIGLISRSIAIIADAVHTLTDVISSAVVVWGFQEVEKPADKEHPYGHGRAEYVAALVVAILLCVTGIEFIKSSINAILHPTPLEPQWWMILAVGLTIIVKEISARYAEFLSAKIASGALHADAWHHRSDALSSGLVVVALIMEKFGLVGVDGWAGIGVSAFIIWTGVVIARDAIDDLIGKPPSGEEIDEIRTLAEKTPGVLGAHDIAVHSYGKDKFVSLHIEIDNDESQGTAHDIAEEVEAVIEKKLDMSPTVHIDPVKISHPVVAEVRDFMDERVKSDPRILGYHDVRVVDTDNHQVILFGIQLAVDLSRKQSVICHNELETAVFNHFPDFDVTIKISGIYLF